MDPYLEDSWGDMHHALITYARDALRRVLPPGLVARLETRTIIEDEFGEERRTVIPDVRIERTAAGGEMKVGAGAALAAQPVVVRLDDEPVTEAYIQLLDVTRKNAVVTVIEFLSPSNKGTKDGRRQYRAKQHEVLRQGASLVEIDLVRGGRWMVRVPERKLKRRLRTPYRVCVTRGYDLGGPEYYAIPLQSPLPTIRVPLRPGEDDAPLSLQPLLGQAYENGSYGDLNDYAADPPPPRLGPADAAWVDDLLRRAGKRK
jgi:hypothetical protein